MSAETSDFNLYDYFIGRERLDRIGSRQAVIFRGQEFSYDQLGDEANHWAGEFLSLGLSPGDRILILLYDSPEFVTSFLASAAIGAIAVPVNTFLSGDDVEFILRDSDARVIIAEDELIDRVSKNALQGRKLISVDIDERPCLARKGAGAIAPVTHRTTRDSPAFILYTSGSTGRPKGVLHRHGSIPATVDTYARTVLKLTETDRVYSASRMFFAYGLGNSLSFTLAAGACSILHTDRASPDFVARLLEEQSPTVFFGVPSLFASLLQTHITQRSLNLGSLRLCVSAGEALPGKIFEDWGREFGLSILDGIGSTEMLHIFISNHTGDECPDSSGRVVRGYEAKLLDEEGKQVPVKQPGNLWVRGPSSTPGYWNMPELTAEVIRDGWVRTGDLYRVSDDGRYRHLGRSDDCFKVKGMWVSPVEVEAALLSHDLVAEAAVVPDFDRDELGSAHAFVVLKQGEGNEVAEEELRRFASSRLPAYKVPSHIQFVSELPRTATGKVQRFKLRRKRDAIGNS
jgi:benzoate-CoA ligase family protein